MNRGESPSSTVVLVRPAARGIEAYLVRRHDAIAFMGGAHVFPGGRVDAADYFEQPRELCDGVDEACARMPDLSRADATAHAVAAVRELFEEAGVLLARAADGSALDVCSPRVAAYRRGLLAGTDRLSAIAAREGLRLALDRLTYFARWVTPEADPRRFDTRFYLAVAPPGQEAVHDDGEAAGGEWMTPEGAIERCSKGDIVLPPPTWTTLRMFQAAATVDEAAALAAAATPVRVQPLAIERNGRRTILLPGDPEYPAVPGFRPRETRFVVREGRWVAEG